MRNPVATILTTVLLLASGPLARAHIVSTDCVLQLIVTPDKATGELWVPILGISIWKAAQQNSDQLQPIKDRQIFAEENAEEVLKGLKITFGDTILVPKVTKTTIQNLWAGLAAEDTEPQPTAVYTLEFTPQEPQPKPPTETTIEHDLLPISPDLSLDRITMLLVRYRQFDQTALRSDVLQADEHVTYKCKWPKAPTATMPSAAPVATPATAPSAPVVGNTGVKVSGYTIAGAAAVVVLGLAAVLLKLRRPDA